MAQCRQHRPATLGVDVLAHVHHPPGVEEKERPDHRQAAQDAGGEHLLADEHQHRRADAQRQALGVDDGERQPAKERRHAVKQRVAHTARDQKSVEHQRQRHRHKGGVEVFLPQGREKLRALHNGRIGIGADEVDVEDVEHIQHRDDGGGDADAERQAVEQPLRRKRPHGQVAGRREQHHHAPAVVAAQPPERGHRRQRRRRGHQPGEHKRPQRPQAVVARRQAAAQRGRAHQRQRAQPQAERPAQRAHAGELDDAEVGEFVDI